MLELMKRFAKTLEFFFGQNFLLVKFVEMYNMHKKFGKGRQEWKKACLNSNIFF
jgi:hypothetical protein